MNAFADSRRVELTLLFGLLAAAFGMVGFRLLKTSAGPAARTGWYRESMSYDELKSRLDHGANPNDIVRAAGPGVSPLLLAVKHADARKTELLLSKGADPSIRNFEVLSEAARQENMSMLKVLLSRGCPKEALNRTLLSSSRSLELSRTLLDAGADPNARVGSKGPVLNVACQRTVSPMDADANVDVVRLLIARGADSVLPDDEGRTAVFVALTSRRKDISHLLLSSRNGKMPKGNAGYMEACALGETRLIVPYLAQGSNPNKAGRYSPLSLAAGSGNVGAVRVLLAQGANPNAGSSLSPCPLSAAATKGNPDVIKLLLAAGANPEGPRGSNDLPLRASIMNEHRYSSLILRKAGARVPKQGWGAPLITILTRFDRIEGIRIYSECGGDLDVKGAVGDTALMHAAQTNNVNAIKALLKAGANPGIRDKLGRTAAGWTRRPEMLAILADAGI